MEKLDTGHQFPTMTINLADGGRISIPADIETPYQVVLFYRGHW